MAKTTRILQQVVLEAPAVPRIPMTAVRDYACALGLVIMATAIAEVLFRNFGLTRLSPVFLAPVLLSGVWLGVRPAMLAAFLSFSVFNFYLVEPRFELKFADAEDYLNLAVFLGVAVLTGGLSGRLREHTDRTLRQAQALRSLFRRSRTLSLATEEEHILAETLAGIMEISGTPAAIWRADDLRILEQDTADSPAADDIKRLVADLLGAGERRTLERAGWRSRLMRADETIVAVAVWQTPREVAEIDGEQLIELLIDLGAATVARVRLTAAKTESAALARMDKLRTAVLSSLSHDFRTPLSAILASASTLADYGDELPIEDRRDLASNIQDEAQSMSNFVTNLLSMTRLESGAVILNSLRVRPLELVHEVTERLERRYGEGRVVARESAGEAYAAADPVLLAQVLVNVLDNALHFGPPDTAVEVEVRQADDKVEIVVLDRGPGVNPQQLPQIFDKFYRIGSDRSAPGGLGLGLSISRGLVEAMDGVISAANRTGGSGLAVTIKLPRAENDAER